MTSRAKERISDFLVSAGRNPFTGQSQQELDFDSLCPRGHDGPGLNLIPTRSRDVRTRLGGRPLMSGDAYWPDGEHQPMQFVGQLDFSELAAIDDCTLPLPRRGILGLFVDAMNPPWGVHANDFRRFRLVYTEHVEEAVLAASESDASPVRILAPSLESTSSGEPTHKVCGQPDWVERDGRLAIHLAASGVDVSHGTLRALTRLEAYGGDAVQMARGASQWRLLWQIDSDEKAGLSWYDSGRLFLFIRDADLVAGNFERAWVRIEST